MSYDFYRGLMIIKESEDILWMKLKSIQRMYLRVLSILMNMGLSFGMPESNKKLLSIKNGENSKVQLKKQLFHVLLVIIVF